MSPGAIPVHRSKRRRQPEFGKIDAPTRTECIARERSECVSALAAARSWLGTPYHHQAAVKGAGCDCLGLVRGVYEELYGRRAETPPAYSRDWAEASRAETMIEAARRHLTPIAPREARPGDVLVFRMRAGAMAKHAAILSAGSLLPEDAGGSGCRMIHAVEGAPASEVHLNAWWRRRVAAAFRFPDKETVPCPTPSAATTAG